MEPGLLGAPDHALAATESHQVRTQTRSNVGVCEDVPQSFSTLKTETLQIKGVMEDIQHHNMNVLKTKPSVSGTLQNEDKPMKLCVSAFPTLTQTKRTQPTVNG